MKKIVLPSDFSENAFNALKFASELLKYERCQFYIVHAYGDEVYQHENLDSREEVERLKELVRQKSENELNSIIERIQKLFSNPKHSFFPVAGFGLFIDEVNDLVNRENADLIVTSTRGATNDRKLTFGSNSLQIIKYVQCPVLGIPVSYEYREPKKILFPSNYMLPYQRRELKLVGDLARSLCAEIDLFYVSRFPLESMRQKDNLEMVKEHFYNVRCEFYQETGSEKTQAIVEAIDTYNIDLLILVNSRHSYLENLLYRSTIDEIGLHPKIPFLVLQNFYRT